jgi:hypothetical protein
MLFRRCLLAGILFFAVLNTAKSQSPTLDTYANQLLFNIFKEQPDTAIRGFLRRYIPSLLDKRTLASKPSSDAQNEYTLEEHSFIFTSHPYFKSRFANGKLEFFCRRLEDGAIQVYDVKLWFEFDDSQQGEIAYSKLIETLSPVSTNTKQSSVNGYMKYQFSDKKATVGINKVQMRLTVDNLDQKRYRILFETTNDL